MLNVEDLSTVIAQGDVLMKEYFECQCFSDEHTLKFTLDEEQPEVYTSVFLYSDSWLQRLWTAVKYVFGYKCKYGHFDCFLMREEDADRMISLLHKYKELVAKRTLQP